MQLRRAKNIASEMDSKTLDTFKSIIDKRQRYLQNAKEARIQNRSTLSDKKQKQLEKLEKIKEHQRSLALLEK